MSRNEFKPFAIGEYANVLTQEEYEALPAVGAGYTAGIAKSEQLNKTWRQASVMSAVLGDFIAEQSGDDVLDDGNLAKLKSSLEKAIHQFLTNSDVDDRYFLQKGGTVGVNGVNSEGDVKSNKANTIVMQSSSEGGDKGYFIQNGDGVNIAFITAYSDGSVRINSLTAGNHNLSFNGVINSDQELKEMGVRVYGPNNPQPVSFPVTSVNNETGDITTSTANFASGWHKDNSTGLITQWGQFGSGSSNIETHNYPIPFPTASLSISGNLGTGVNEGNTVYLQLNDKSSFTSKVSGSSMGVSWIAIGY
ncbi:gp53-like domain-containing protein [Serratia marcescens]|uniref:gp53-like domain-containing protein n=1 Tax=Serratia marcescens TaxID=615 RepID=UPI003AFB3B53